MWVIGPRTSASSEQSPRPRQEPYPSLRPSSEDGGVPTRRIGSKPTSTSLFRITAGMGFLLVSASGAPRLMGPKPHESSCTERASSEAIRPQTTPCSPSEPSARQRERNWARMGCSSVPRSCMKGDRIPSRSRLSLLLSAQWHQCDGHHPHRACVLRRDGRRMR